MLVLHFLTNFCESWFLWWLLPFLLGLLLGWAIWAKWAKIARELEDEVASLKAKINDLEEKLEACGKDKKRCQNALTISESRVKDLKLKITELESEIEKMDPGDDDESDSNGTGSLGFADSHSSEGADDEQGGEEDSGEGEQDNDEGDDDQQYNVVASSLAGTLIPEPSSTTSFTGAGKYDKLQDDNLQIIEGVGPKMESILHENGVNSWSKLSSMSTGELQSILDKYGDRYRIIDPSGWPAQAAFASRGDWDGLIASQKEDGSASKAENVMIKLGIIKAWKQDDLKAIEGIGPKIEQLMHNAGITTWRQMAEASVSQLNSILESAGKRYQLADPSTWPQQASLAADERWDELERLQDHLKGGKDPS